MRTLLLSILALGTLLGGTRVAHAGFFDACLAPGVQYINVVQDTVVVGEKVTLGTRNDNCLIEVADGVSLTLKNVRVATSDEYIRFDGGATSSLAIVNTSIGACDADILGLTDQYGFKQVTIKNSRLVDPTTGACDLKEIYVAGDLTITDSLINSDSSLDMYSKSGNIALKNDTLISDYVYSTTISAISGGVTVETSRLKSNDAIDISGAGQVKVTGNVFRAAGTTTISGHPCASTGNRPPVSCS
jgi:hypothetical protein